MIFVKMAYKSGFQIYVTSAVLLDSSNNSVLNYFNTYFIFALSVSFRGLFFSAKIIRCHWI